MEAQPSLGIDQAVSNRLELWRNTVQAELQSLLQEASALRTKIDTAKTDVKKRYYGKKFNKVTADVMQMLAAVQRLDAHGAELEKQATNAVSNDSQITG